MSKNNETKFTTNIDKQYTRARHNYISQKADSIAIGADAVDIGTIFTLTIETTLHRFLEETAKYILFPIAALINVFRAIVSWRDAAANKGKNGTAYNAFVETVAALGISVAVVGGLAFGYIFASITPIIFASVMAFKTIANGLAGAFYFGKSLATADPAEKTAYRQKATLYAAATTATLFAGIAVTGVMILFHQYMSVIGILSAAAGVFAAVYKWQHSKKPEPTNSIDDNVVIDTMTFDDDYDHSESPSKQIRQHASSTHYLADEFTGLASDKTTTPKVVSGTVEPLPPSDTVTINHNTYLKKFSVLANNQKQDDVVVEPTPNQAVSFGYAQ